MNHKIDKNEFKKSVVANVRNLYRKNIEEANGGSGLSRGRVGGQGYDH